MMKPNFATLCTRRVFFSKYLPRFRTSSIEPCLLVRLPGENRYGEGRGRHRCQSILKAVHLFFLIEGVKQSKFGVWHYSKCRLTIALMWLMVCLDARYLCILVLSSCCCSAVVHDWCDMWLPCNGHFMAVCWLVWSHECSQRRARKAMLRPSAQVHGVRSSISDWFQWEWPFVLSLQDTNHL